MNSIHAGYLNTCELGTLFMTTNKNSQFYEIMFFLTNCEFKKQNSNSYIDYGKVIRSILYILYQCFHRCKIVWICFSRKKAKVAFKKSGSGKQGPFHHKPSINPDCITLLAILWDFLLLVFQDHFKSSKQAITSVDISKDYITELE